MIHRVARGPAGAGREGVMYTYYGQQIQCDARGPGEAGGNGGYYLGVVSCADICVGCVSLCMGGGDMMVHDITVHALKSRFHSVRARTLCASLSLSRARISSHHQ